MVTLRSSRGTEKRAPRSWAAGGAHEKGPNATMTNITHPTGDAQQPRDHRDATRGLLVDATPLLAPDGKVITTVHDGEEAGRLPVLHPDHGRHVVGRRL